MKPVLKIITVLGMAGGSFCLAGCSMVEKPAPDVYGPFGPITPQPPATPELLGTVQAGDIVRFYSSSDIGFAGAQVTVNDQQISSFSSTATEIEIVIPSGLTSGTYDLKVRVSSPLTLVAWASFQIP